MQIVFQGDSITDCGRNDWNLGVGYAFLCSATLAAEQPLQHAFYNRGISGHRVTDLFARWKKDCLALKPDFLSILVGINDVWHEFYETPNGVDPETFEKVYDMLLEQTFKTLPNIKIVLMEPFVVHGSATDDRWEEFTAGAAVRRAAVRRLAEKYALPTIPLQEIFDKAITRAPADYWTHDGVHPTPAGHRLIADAWLQAFHAVTKL